MYVGFWELKVTASMGNTQGIVPHGMLNQSDQPTQFGHFFEGFYRLKS
jgi:hypothetical protein